MPTFDKDKHISLFQFADDTAVVAKGRCFDNTRDHLVGAIETLLAYAEEWKVKINPLKTEVLRFGLKRAKQPYIAV